MKAIIHIGMAKTGSTSIQSWMVSNRAVLEAVGVKALAVRLIEGKPYTATKSALSHVAMHEMGANEKIAWPWESERCDSNYVDLSEAFDKLSRESGLFVYSNENLYSFTELHMIALDKFFARFFDEVTYVVYIRDSVDLIASAYSQKILYFNKKFGSISFSELVEICMRESSPFGVRSDYSNLLVWGNVFGKRLSVRLLDSNWLFKGDLIRDFASLVGFEAHQIPKIMNESLAAEYIEYCREILIHLGQGFHTNFRRPVMNALVEASSGKPKLSVSDEQAKAIYELRRVVEERIRIRFFPDRSRLFFPKHRGGGIAPTPLTPQRKREIESLIREKIPQPDWEQFLRARVAERNR